MRDILNLTDEFEAKMGTQLAVNRTDLEAMEQLIMSGPLSPSEIARRLEISTAAATQAVDRLILAGHVSRSPHPTDRRGVLVVPSPASVGAAMGILMPMLTGMDAAITVFSDAERETITAYLRRVAEVYREQLARDA